MASKLRWIKLHLDVRTDQKLSTLTDQQFRVFMNLLLYSAETEPRGVIDYSEPEIVAIETAKGDEKLLSETVSRLLRLRILESEEQYIGFINFAERQYEKPSDHPAEVARRVREHRARRADNDAV